VAYTTVEFWKVNATAGKLMLPYLAFVAYANALNYRFWKDNPEVRASAAAACSRVWLFSSSSSSSCLVQLLQRLSWSVIHQDFFAQRCFRPEGHL
jgi:hypothetical protein